MCRNFKTYSASKCSAPKEQIARTISRAFVFCEAEPSKCPVYQMCENSLLHKTVQAFQKTQNQIVLKEVNYG